MEIEYPNKKLGEVLYQWCNLVPTIERRLTKVSDVYLTNFNTRELKFIANIQGEAELPIQNISMKNINVANSHPMHHIAPQMWRVLCINTQPDE